LSRSSRLALTVAAVFLYAVNRGDVRMIQFHMTFEQTCLGGFPSAVGFFGKGTGELWIVNGIAGFLS
jgi:hypothetical protein